jgi:hypothetical protein
MDFHIGRICQSVETSSSRATGGLKAKSILIARALRTGAFGHLI